MDSQESSQDPMYNTQNSPLKNEDRDGDRDRDEDSEEIQMSNKRTRNYQDFGNQSQSQSQSQSGGQSGDGASWDGSSESNYMGNIRNSARGRPRGRPRGNRLNHNTNTHIQFNQTRNRKPQQIPTPKPKPPLRTQTNPLQQTPFKKYPKIFEQSEDEQGQHDKLQLGKQLSNDSDAESGSDQVKDQDQGQGPGQHDHGRENSQLEEKEEFLSQMQAEKSQVCHRRSIFVESSDGEESDFFNQDNANGQEQKEAPLNKNDSPKQAHNNPNPEQPQPKPTQPNRIQPEPSLQPQPQLQPQLQLQLQPQCQNQKPRHRICHPKNPHNKEYQTYSQQYQSYKSRRIMKYINGKIDVNVRYLHQLVYDCYEEDLICEDLMLGIKYMGLGNTLEFMEKYREEKLGEFLFGKVGFTVFDHRRLVKLLKEKGKKKQYTDQMPIYFMPYQLHLFMTEVYALPQDSYTALCESIDEAYELNWWKTIGTELKGKQPVKPISEQQSTPNPKPSRNPPKRSKQRRQPQPSNKPPPLPQPQSQPHPSQSEREINNFKILMQEDNEHNEQSYNDSSMAAGPLKSFMSKESLFSSSVFQTQKILDSQFSIDSDLDVSDLEGKNREIKKKKEKVVNTKEMLEEKEMQKVKKSSQNLKKIEQTHKNPKRKPKTPGKPTPTPAKTPQKPPTAPKQKPKQIPKKAQKKGTKKPQLPQPIKQQNNLEHSDDSGSI